jgi:alkanesulfonate monooxygenase SsuD/methylene tetrahydromethanopterin reductase-like flavin-dependent oxidoreductase (luciferase family)
MAVPDDLVDAVALVGPPDRIRDRVQLWQDGPATTLNLMTADIETVRLMAELLL